MLSISFLSLPQKNMVHDIASERHRLVQHWSLPRGWIYCSLNNVHHDLIESAALWIMITRNLLATVHCWTFIWSNTCHVPENNASPPTGPWSQTGWFSVVNPQVGLALHHPLKRKREGMRKSGKDSQRNLMPLWRCGKQQRQSRRAIMMIGDWDIARSFWHTLGNMSLGGLHWTFCQT